MSVKALRNQLLAAIAMVLVAALALGSSTFAWFASNNTVTATGMEVTVQSNETFLLINTGENDTATEIQTAGATSIPVSTISAEEAVVFPSKPKELAEIGENKLFTTGTPVTNAATAGVADNWYTAHNNNPAKSTDSVKDINSLNTTSTSPYYFNKYVIKRTVYLTLAEGSDDAHNLTVRMDGVNKLEGTANTYDAVRCLVACGSNYVILNKSSTTAQSLHTTDFAITDDASVQVDIYIYYDGSDASVFTNNKADLTGASFNLIFGVETGTVA